MYDNPRGKVTIVIMIYPLQTFLYVCNASSSCEILKWFITAIYGQNIG